MSTHEFCQYEYTYRGMHIKPKEQRKKFIVGDLKKCVSTLGLYIYLSLAAELVSASSIKNTRHIATSVTEADYSN